MPQHPTLLKRLLLDRHWQTHHSFCREYVRAARYLHPDQTPVAPSRKQFGRWINGHLTRLPHPEHCQVLEAMFPGHSARRLFAPEPAPGVHTSSDAILESPPRREDQTTDRRDALRFGGTLTAGYLLDSLDSLHTEPARLHAALNTSTTTPDHIAALETTADDLGVRVIQANPPSTLIPEVLTEFRGVRMLLERRQRTADQVRLTRVAARLAIAMGNIVFDENDFPNAGRWYHAGQQAATEAGDQYLADMALGLLGYLPAYSGDPGAVLALIDPRLDQTKITPTPAVAFLWASKARAHATLGEKIAFRHAINRARRALDASPGHDSRYSAFTFPPGKLFFYQATGCARLGDVEGATEAADRALGLYDLTMTGDPALVRFDKATALAKAGELAEATQVASHALLDQYTYPGSSVLARAREFDALLGEPRTPAVRDWREILTTTTRSHTESAPNT